MVDFRLGSELMKLKSPTKSGLEWKILASELGSLKPQASIGYQRPNKEVT